MYYFFSDNNLLSLNQSEFRSVSCCISQLYSNNHEILNAFDKELVVRGIFLDILKAFGKVWHDDLIFKLCQIGISRRNIDTLRGYFVTENSFEWSVFILV